VKIEKCVNTDIEVEVEIDLEDIVCAIAESTDSAHLVMRGISNFHRFLKAVPDEMVRQMNEKQRKTIHDALLPLVKRFASDASEKQ
jgi:hypothetical protein